jgi:hypothetical protein
VIKLTHNNSYFYIVFSRDTSSIGYYSSKFAECGESESDAVEALEEDLKKYCTGVKLNKIKNIASFTYQNDSYTR